jgi:hypothetical protein
VKPLDFGAQDENGDDSDDGFIDFTPQDDSDEDDSDNEVESAATAAAVDTNQINNSAADL